MMKIETLSIPGFSALKMKRELQERVNRITAGMTREERLEHTRQAAERFRREIMTHPAQQQQEIAAAEK